MTKTRHSTRRLPQASLQRRKLQLARAPCVPTTKAKQQCPTNIAQFYATSSPPPLAGTHRCTAALAKPAPATSTITAVSQRLPAQTLDNTHTEAKQAKRDLTHVRSEPRVTGAEQAASAPSALMHLIAIVSSRKRPGCTAVGAYARGPAASGVIMRITECADLGAVELGHWRLHRSTFCARASRSETTGSHTTACMHCR